ncbi:hypothetical protein JYK00_01135 [Thermosipho ferrireducens]|uniref:Uncharacterized protein n=1 Tax=Thermosipho ferrireducens TaxID=2571116 RepID=A0ABX7S7I4_9BACT|nr:hypothetical protein [Thermosipho ferrireducens]QTA38174.1 hypothetical protein JYK00_01135 [Thermosipho ferrireducens]
MSKKWYKLVINQIQPIHLGKAVYGVLGETRIFIPGQTVWGALAKAYCINKKLPFEKNKNLFEEITCFYPAFDNQSFLKPRFSGGEFYLGDLPEREFKLLFADTFVSTAVLPETKSAKDESLHEIEYILPRHKKELESTELYKKLTQLGYKNSNLKWVGLIKLEENIKKEIEGMEIYVGGDVRYGFGLMKITKITETYKSMEEDFNIISEIKKGKINNADFPSENITLLNFFCIDNTDVKIEGKIEIIIEKDFYDNNRQNIEGKIVHAGYYAVPGSKILKNI